MPIFEVFESAGWGGRHAVLTRAVPSTGKLLLFEEPLAVLKPDFSFDGAFPSSGDEVGSGDACNSRVCHSKDDGWHRTWWCALTY